MMRFALFGCGNIAQRSVIPALVNSEVSSLVVCIDTNEERGKEFTKKYNIPFESDLLTAFSNYTFDAVYISTPNSVHKEIIMAAAKYKKHILCQKSLVTNYADAVEVVNVSRKLNVAIYEGFMYQFHTQHSYLKTLIANGEIGTPFHFQAWFGFPPLSSEDFRYSKKMGGGALLDAGSYTVHSARHFFNLEPIDIYSVLENEGNEIEVKGTAMLNFGHSKTAHLVFGFNNSYQNKYSIWGTTGLLTLDRAFGVPPDYKSVITIEKQGIKKEYLMEPCNHFIEEIKYFVENCYNKVTIKYWQDEILHQAKVLERMRSIS